VTDKVSPSRSDADHEDPSLEADLDAALWPDDPDKPGMAGPTPGSVKAAPRISPRDRIRSERERGARRRRRIRVLTVGAGVLVLAAAAATAGITSDHGGQKAVPAPFGYLGPYAPVMLNADNSVTMARPGVTQPVLDIYEDFQCPECRTFEKSDGTVIQQLAAQGKVKVVYYPFTIYSSQPQLANSIRGWAAARCAPANRWASYHNALYAHQPSQTESGGFAVSLLIQLGKETGITSPAFAQCVRSQEYAAQDEPFSEQIIYAGMTTMPDLTLNGHALGSSLTPSALRKLILAKAKNPAKPSKQAKPKTTNLLSEWGGPTRRGGGRPP
jgi:protein-disulfide isomerase